MSTQDQSVLSAYSVFDGRLSIRQIVERKNISARRVNWILRAYGEIPTNDPDTSIGRKDSS